MIQQHKSVLPKPISKFHKFLNKDGVFVGAGVLGVCCFVLLLNRKSDSKVHGKGRSHSTIAWTFFLN